MSRPVFLFLVACASGPVSALRMAAITIESGMATLQPPARACVESGVATTWLAGGQSSGWSNMQSDRQSEEEAYVIAGASGMRGFEAAYDSDTWAWGGDDDSEINLWDEDVTASLSEDDYSEYYIR